MLLLLVVVVVLVLVLFISIIFINWSLQNIVYEMNVLNQIMELWMSSRCCDVCMCACMC